MADSQLGVSTGTDANISVENLGTKNLTTTAIKSLDNANALSISAAGAAKIDGSAITQPISAASLPLPTGAATAALQTQPGVDIGDVTINNAVGASAVNVQDGGNSLTVDGTVTANAGTGIFTVADNQTITDNAAFTDSTSKVLMAGFAFDETAGTALTENDAAAARIDSKRAIVVTLEDATTRGTRAGVTANGLAVQQATAANLNATVTVVPATSNGLSMSHTVSAASTNATSLKASAGKVYAVQVFNLNAAPRYLKLYNKASAPTVGTDTPVKVIMAPGNTAGAGAIACEWTNGLDFTTGIAWALTTGMANADTAAVAATELLVEIDYK